MYSLEKVSNFVFKIVENDVFKQYPFAYVINLPKQIVIIDSTCGLGQFRSFIETHFETKNKRILLIATHCHFDHSSLTSIFIL